MTLLASILPGLREFRVPFSSGVVWLSAIAVFFYPSRSRFSESSGGRDVTELVTSLPSGIQLSAVAFLAYLLGVVLTALVTGLVSWGRRWLPGRGRPSNPKIAPRGPTFAWMRARIVLYPEHVSSLLAESVIRRAMPNASQAVVDLVPRTLLDDEAQLAALRLSNDYPDQFQHYDRVKSEADFRAALVAPVTVLAMSLAWILHHPLWSSLCLVVLLGAALMLSVIAHRNRTDARQILLTAIHLRWTVPPTLEAIDRDLGQLDTTDQQHRVNEMVVVIEHVALSGSPDAARMLLARMRHDPRAEQQNLYETASKRLSQGASEVLAALLAVPELDWSKVRSRA
jgi:hypothetical protein